MDKRAFLVSLFSVGCVLSGCLPCVAETLSLDDVFAQALSASYDLKIVRAEVNINRAAVTIARSDYFPTLQSYANTEYLKSLGEQNTSVAVVGNNVLPSGTLYQNSLGVNLNHNLVDFGVRRRKLSIARRDVEIKQLAEMQIERDLKLKLVDIFSEALWTLRQIQSKGNILAAYQH